MTNPSPDGSSERPDGQSVREVPKPEHPISLYDPVWLRRLHDRCLWDGGTKTEQSEFCCAVCEERYTDWEFRTVHVILGREPLQTFLEQGRDLP